ncbi:MAG TPA: hypothetical protein VHR66_23100 [Gemmataceae bacterium]|jgi:hypothetical protein|nr:hypothetical protein [Gemmataceae bacterium]
MFFAAHRERVRFSIKDNRIKGVCEIEFPNGRKYAQSCVIDTGAMRTLVPQDVWEPFDRPSFTSGLKRKSANTAGGKLPVYAVKCTLRLSAEANAGPSGPYDLGTCDVLLACDADAVAKEKAQDPNSPREPLKEILLGLGGGALEKGGLCINWKEKHAYFIEVDDPPK